MNEPELNPIPLDRALTILEQGAITEQHGLMRWSSNDAYLVSVQHEGDEVLAVYKPQAGENPLWDFPDGTLCLRERAAFLTSQALGWQIVPPTVLREAAHGLGSLQVFIHHDPNQHYFTFTEGFAAQLQRLCAFDHIINNADRKGGHCLLDDSGHIWGIDHGISFHMQHKLRTVIWEYAGQPIGDDLLADMLALCGKLEQPEDPFTQAMGALLSPVEMRALNNRLQRLLYKREFPTPGPHGPNYPWPAV